MEKQTFKTTYYELENTISEYHSTINYRSSNLSKVKEKMNDYSDWWCPMGTGKIYQVDIYENSNNEIIIERNKIFDK